MTSAAVFVLTIQATAGPENSDPDGRRYHLLVFARGADEAAAEAAGRRALGQLGWIDVAIIRSGEITDPSGVPPDLAANYQRALRHGCSVIVYDEP
jgi:hypothetical protein